MDLKPLLEYTLHLTALAKVLSIALQHFTKQELFINGDSFRNMKTEEVHTKVKGVMSQLKGNLILYNLILNMYNNHTT